MSNVWNKLEVLFSDEQVFEKARLVVPFFYYFVEFMTFMQLRRATQFSGFELHLSWPVSWLNLVPQLLPYASYILFTVLVVTVSVGALCYKYRAARFFAFFGILQYQGFVVSATGHEHDYYIPLFVSLFLALGPNVWSKTVSASERKKFMLIFWACQAYIALTYTMSGFYKLLMAILQSGGTHSNYFSFDAAALYVSYWLEYFQQQSLLGNFIVDINFSGGFPSCSFYTYFCLRFGPYSFRSFTRFGVWD